MRTNPLLAVLATLGMFLASACSQQVPTTQARPITTAQEPSMQPSQTPAQQLSIKTGTYFGECLGYCNDELSITSEKMIYLKTTNVKDETYPDIVEEAAITTEDWNDLVALVDLDTFNALPDTIGCPDCADQGGEWVEISDGRTTKRIDFELGASVAEIDRLVSRLRGLREEFSSRHRA